MELRSIARPRRLPALGWLSLCRASFCWPGRAHTHTPALANFLHLVGGERASRAVACDMRAAWSHPFLNLVCIHSFIRRSHPFAIPCFSRMLHLIWRARGLIRQPKTCTSRSRPCRCTCGYVASVPMSGRLMRRWTHEFSDLVAFLLLTACRTWYPDTWSKGSSSRRSGCTRCGGARWKASGWPSCRRSGCAWSSACGSW